jgi:hypothetical protein
MESAFTEVPQPPLRWNHAPEEVLQLTKEAIQRDREVSATKPMLFYSSRLVHLLQVRDKIAALPQEERNFLTVRHPSVEHSPPA